MSNSKNSRSEQPSTYVVQDRSNKEEIQRLLIQDQMVTKGMGGPLAEQPDPTVFQQVLDVGCGTGGWLIELAKAFPTLTHLVGVDISGKMISYAREQAAEQQVADRITFHIMDALRKLEFPDDSFDLINQRLGMSYLRTWDWPNLLGEYLRIGRAGGVIRITEGSIPESNSPALNRLNDLFLHTLSQAGHIFITEDRNGVIDELTRLLKRYGIRNVEAHLHTLEYLAGSMEAQSFIKDEQHLFRTFLPFFQKWSRVPDDYENIYQQASVEMQQPDFHATWRLLTAWGTLP